MAAAEGYDPSRSAVSSDKLADFLRSDVAEELTTIPGIGPVAKERLVANGIETAYQLVGKFLMLRRPGMTSKEHCDSMWYFLKSIRIDSYRSGIVRCIAEKCDIMIPGIYNEGDIHA